MAHKSILGAALFSWVCYCANAVSAESLSAESLTETILKQDSVLFDAFNHCELAAWRNMLDENIEFYQDNSSVTTSRDALEPSFLDRCDEFGNAVLIRALIPESVEVHPIMQYGAVQFGRHRFSLRQPNGEYKIVSEPAFVHLWQHNKGTWRITRVISYGH